MTPGPWRISAARSVTLDRPCIMAIINTTPDSFYDGGVNADPAAAADAALRAVRGGAQVLDIGGESTRPGATAVDAQEQLRRVIPAIEAIRTRPETANVPITIDTTSATVADAALDAGADAINDVSGGLDDPGMLPLAAARGAGIILMHRLTSPDRDSYSDQYADAPRYRDVVLEIRDFLQSRAAAAIDAGIPAPSIVLDPGLGFGKTVKQNVELIRRTHELASLGFPILSALSRKSFVGRVATGSPTAASERLSATLGASVAHLFSGASIFRVHDVQEHASALSMAWAVRVGADALA